MGEDERDDDESTEHADNPDVVRDAMGESGPGVEAASLVLAATRAKPDALGLPGLYPLPCMVCDGWRDYRWPDQRAYGHVPARTVHEGGACHMDPRMVIGRRLAELALSGELDASAVVDALEAIVAISDDVRDRSQVDALGADIEDICAEAGIEPRTDAEQKLGKFAAGLEILRANGATSVYGVEDGLVAVGGAKRMRAYERALLTEYGWRLVRDCWVWEP